MNARVTGGAGSGSLAKLSAILNIDREAESEGMSGGAGPDTRAAEDKRSGAASVAQGGFQCPIHVTIVEGPRMHIGLPRAKY